MLHEVYIATVKNKIVYIGSGKLNRHQHITSGVSHVYMLNKITFTAPNTIKIIVLHKNLTKERSLELEMTLIDEYQPVFNCVGTKSLNNKYEQQYYYDELIKEDNK